MLAYGLISSAVAPSIGGLAWPDHCLCSTQVIWWSAAGSEMIASQWKPETITVSFLVIFDSSFTVLPSCLQLIQHWRTWIVNLNHYKCVDHLAFFYLGCSLNLDFKAIPPTDRVLFTFFCWILQEQVAKLKSIPVKDVCLYCSGSPLNEDVLVANLRSLSIDVSVCLKGGKVHGSLAHAGKVKGQTPKVRESSKS
jgi:hypothetical protein